MGITRLTVIGLTALVSFAPVAGAQGQRRSGGGTATFAIMVSDPAGAPLGNVKVAMQGPMARESRTENGRIAFENLPLGTYRLRFDRDGFIPFEREVVARAGAPIEVKVILSPAPEPPKPPPAPAPVAPPTPAITAEAVGLDISTYLDKNFVGRAATKTSNLACSAGGTATLLQFRESVAEHSHADADEYLYVIAGTGSARIGETEQPLQPSVFVQVPRSMPHVLTVRGKTPLVVLSIRAGEPCAAAPQL